LADLVEELSNLLASAGISLPEVSRLATETANLAHALHDGENPRGLAAARQRLEAAALRAEETAPLVSGFVQRLLDTLANLGI
jgi:hypothetical protein